MIKKTIGKIHWWFKEKFNHFYKKRILFTRNLKIKYYEKRYFKEFGVKLNINKPETFYDKLNYLKFHSFQDNMSDFTDKIKAKEIANSFGGHCKVAKLLKVFTSFREFLDWSRSLSDLSEECVVKTNNGSGAVFFITIDSNKKPVIRDKHGKLCDANDMIKAIKRSLHTNWYYQEFESNYRKIKPKVFLEEYFSTMSKVGLNEYKFFCNFGNVKLVNIVYNRQDNDNLMEVFTDESLKPFDVRQGRKIIEKNDIIKPHHLDEMIKFASHFSSSFPFLRVDLLCDNSNYYFCEFTFYDFGGFSCFYPVAENKRIGDMFDLSDKK